jgi:hypothetical protein
VAAILEKHRLQDITCRVIKTLVKEVEGQNVSLAVLYDEMLLLDATGAQAETKDFLKDCV